MDIMKSHLYITVYSIQMDLLRHRNSPKDLNFRLVLYDRSEQGMFDLFYLSILIIIISPSANH